jgi:hypothetical protein
VAASARAQRSDELGDIRGVDRVGQAHYNAAHLELEPRVATSRNPNGQNLRGSIAPPSRHPVSDSRQRHAETLRHDPMRLTRVDRCQHLLPKLLATSHRRSASNSRRKRSSRPFPDGYAVALGRKNYLFVGHEEAGENIAGLYSLVATCDANDVNPYEYLRDVLMRVSTHPADRIDELLPDQWKPVQDA